MNREIHEVPKVGTLYILIRMPPMTVKAFLIISELCKTLKVGLGFSRHASTLPFTILSAFRLGHPLSLVTTYKNFTGWLTEHQRIACLPLRDGMAMAREVVSPTLISSSSSSTDQI